LGELLRLRRILLFTGETDVRKGYDGLAALVTAAGEKALQQNATVYFMACRFANAVNDDAPSERLLRELSLLWPTVRVVACRSVVWVDGPVGARVTPVLHCSNYGPPESLPWVTMEGAHVTIAQDGNIIQRGIVPT
jgi:hypothetical protein